LTNACPEDKKGASHCHETDTEKMDSIIQEAVKSKKLRKDGSRLTKIISSEDAASFAAKSKQAMYAVKLLGAAAEGHGLPLSKNHYTLVRDYLVSETIL